MTRTLPFLLALFLALPTQAQKKQLTFDAIYDPATKVSFGGAIQSGFDWLDDTTFLYPQRDERNRLVDWRLYDTAAGKHRTFIDRARLQAALEAAGATADDAKEAADETKQTFDAKKNAIVLVAGGDLYLFTIDRATATRLTSTAPKEEVPAFSPDGASIAFVRDHDLYVLPIGGVERRITNDGTKDILNGKLDWVYQEEIYGRGLFRAFWWSPDSRRLAFLQLDERPVPEFTVVDHIPYRQELEVEEYPKAGDPNPLVKLFIAPANGGARTQVDTSRYADQEHLIVNVTWNGSALSYQVQDREQTWLDLVTADAGGASKVLFRETTKAWVDPIANPTWLADGSFLWQSERTGWRHLYHFKADGSLIRQITNGEWEVRDLHGIDEKAGYAYFSGTARSPIASDVYRVRLNGNNLQRLSNETGTHAATFSPSMQRYVDKWSDIHTPDQIRVHTNDGRVMHVVEANRVAALAEYDLPRPEFLQVKTRDGFVMEAMMIRPPNFDSSKKYPVYQFVYGAPHAQQVRNVWRGQFMLFNQLIANQGIIVFQADNRTASGKGAVSMWSAYQELGRSELQDLEDGVTWLKSQPYVDGSRIMLNGWSYGGFMVSYALTHSKSFKAGVAGGSVTDWRDYDTVYTERLLRKPQNNPEGYERSSPRFAAASLHGNLLLLHGTMDDNVHVQNTIQFAYELQKAGKKFEMMLYPKSRHAIIDPALQKHMQATVFDFVRRNLLDGHQ